MFPKIILNDLRKFPIKDVNLDKQEPFIKSAEVNLRLNKEMKLLSFKFKSLLESDLSLERTSKKLETWFNLDWGEFENEIRKQKIILKGEQKEDWFDRFNRLKLNAQTLKNQINQTDKEIDEMVYELYGLTKEEIEIVENS